MKRIDSISKAHSSYTLCLAVAVENEALERVGCHRDLPAFKVLVLVLAMQLLTAGPGALGSHAALRLLLNGCRALRCAMIAYGVRKTSVDRTQSRKRSLVKWLSLKS